MMQAARPRNMPHLRAMTRAVMVVCMSLGAAIPAAAQNNVSQTINRYEIPGGTLDQVLNRFAAQANVLLAIDAKLTAGKASNGLTGSFTVQDGLAAILASTGLEAVAQPTGGYALRVKAAGQTAISATDTQLPVVEVVGMGASETATSSVIAYKANRSATGTKTDTPILETPVSVQVIPRDVIEDQKALSLRDVYENISGVQASGNTLNAQSEVLPIIRGFESPSLMRNGVRATYAGAVDMVNIERVEVLKGPASILYGALEPGGIVNYVTKRPQEARSAVFDQQVGSHDFRRTAGDLTGSMNESGSWMYRLNFAQTDSDSFRDHMYLERTAIAPSFLWRPNAATELLLDFSYVKERQPYDSGIPIDANGRPLAARSAFFNAPNLAGRSNEDYYAGYQLTHAFNANWSIRNQLQLHRAANKNETLRPRALVGNSVLMRYQNEDRIDDEVQFVTDITGKFTTGNVAHTLLIGAEYIEQKFDWLRYRVNAPAVAITDRPLVNYTPPANQVPGLDLGKTRWNSLYVQDQISLNEDGRLKFLVGGRFDDVRTQSSSSGIADKDVNDRAFTARGGLLYQLTPLHSMYFSVSQSFKPQTGITVDISGNPLRPEKGIQYEAGVKGSFLDERLLATAAIYKIEKNNVAVVDQNLFDATGQTAYYPGVRQQSKGIEFDISGKLSRQWKVLGSYGYADTRVLANDSEPAQVGKPLPGISPHVARLWLAYDFEREGAWSGLGVGGGLRYMGKSSAQANVDLKLPAYTVADMSIWYQWKNLRASLNIKNLFDRDYISRASTNAIAHPGAPRTITAGLTIGF